MSNLWMQTYSNKRIDIEDLDPNEICIEDICHSLSMTCRFTGHAKFHYSVGLHSINVMNTIIQSDKKYTLDDLKYALLHDFSEAYLNDISSGMKKTNYFEGYRVIEAKLQAMIYNKYGLYGDEPSIVKWADLSMLKKEAKVLMPRHVVWDDFPYETSPIEVIEKNYKDVEIELLSTFYKLFT